VLSIALDFAADGSSAFSIEAETTDVVVDVLFVSCAADFSNSSVSCAGIEASAALVSAIVVEEALLGIDLESGHI
jgi:hypothetical protein